MSNCVPQITKQKRHKIDDSLININIQQLYKKQHRAQIKSENIKNINNQIVLVFQLSNRIRIRAEARLCKRLIELPLKIPLIPSLFTTFKKKLSEFQQEFPIIRLFLIVSKGQTSKLAASEEKYAHANFCLKFYEVTFKVSQIPQNDPLYKPTPRNELKYPRQSDIIPHFFTIFFRQYASVDFGEFEIRILIVSIGQKTALDPHPPTIPQKVLLKNDFWPKELKKRLIFKFKYQQGKNLAIPNVLPFHKLLIPQFLLIVLKQSMAPLQD